MSVELARRLIRSGVIAPEEVERALFESVTIGMAFAQSLAARGSDLLKALERELGKTDVPLARLVRVAPEIAAELPLGLCERLLAVPIGRDAKSAAVDIACVDPLDPQIGSELGYHLRGAVRIFRAPLTEVLLAIDLWLDERDAVQSVGTRTPAFGTSAVKKPSSPPPGRLSLRPPRALLENADGVPVSPPTTSEVNPSEPPIPLVRRSLSPDPPARVERFRKGTDPGVGTGNAFLMVPEMDESGEPVIGLYRSKPAVPQAVTISALPEERVKEALARLDAAQAPPAVISALVTGLEVLATRVLVLAVRAGAYEARAGSSSLGDSERLRSLRVEIGQSSVLDTATQSGYFLGHLPGTAIHDGLRALFGDGELYAARIDVSGRPALFYVIAGLETAFAATRRADELARAASRALERIVRSRKHA